MAGLVFSSDIDKRKFDAKLAAMEKQMRGAGATAKKYGVTADSAFRKAATAAGGFFTVIAAAQAGKKLVTFSKELETALVEVATISKAVTADMEGYKDMLVALSTEGSQSAKELTEAYYDIVSAGYDGEQGLQLLAVAQQAGVAGFVDLSTAADGVTTVLNAWGKSVTEAESVSDIFFKTVELGKTTFPELGSSIAQVAPLAAASGVSFEEISAAIATLTAQGTPTSQAITQIRGALIAVNSNLGDGWRETMNFQQALVRMREQAGGSQVELKKMVGRIEGVIGILGLTGVQADRASSSLAAMNDTFGTTAAAAAKVAETTDYQIKNLGNNILAALEPLGEAAKESLGSIAEYLNEGLESGNIEKVVKQVGYLVGALVLLKTTSIAYNGILAARTRLMYMNIASMRLARISGNKFAVAQVFAARATQTLNAAIAANPIGIMIVGLAIAIPLMDKYIYGASSDQY